LPFSLHIGFHNAYYFTDIYADILDIIILHYTIAAILLIFIICWCHYFRHYFHFRRCIIFDYYAFHIDIAYAAMMLRITLSCLHAATLTLSFRFSWLFFIFFIILLRHIIIIIMLLTLAAVCRRRYWWAPWYLLIIISFTIIHTLFFAFDDITITIISFRLLLLLCPLDYFDYFLHYAAWFSLSPPPMPLFSHYDSLRYFHYISITIPPLSPFLSSFFYAAWCRLIISLIEIITRMMFFADYYEFRYFLSLFRLRFFWLCPSLMLELPTLFTLFVYAFMPSFSCWLFFAITMPLFIFYYAYFWFSFLFHAATPFVDYYIFFFFYIAYYSTLILLFRYYRRCHWLFSFYHDITLAYYYFMPTSLRHYHTPFSSFRYYRHASSVITTYFIVYLSLSFRHSASSLHATYYLHATY